MKNKPLKQITDDGPKLVGYCQTVEFPDKRGVNQTFIVTQMIAMRFIAYTVSSNTGTLLLHWLTPEATPSHVQTQLVFRSGVSNTKDYFRNSSALRGGDQEEALMYNLKSNIDELFEVTGLGGYVLSGE